MTTNATDSGTTQHAIGADLGLLIVRGVIGVLFMGHGLGKLFGWFNQSGVEGTGAFFESLGYSPGQTWAVVAGLTELVAGALLLTGFLVPLAAAMIIGDMINAAAFKNDAGFWIADGGYEYELVLMAVMVGLAAAGPGGYSVDRDRDWFGNRIGGVAVAVVLGIVSGVVLLLVRD